MDKIYVNGREQVIWAPGCRGGRGSPFLGEEHLLLGYEPQAASDYVG